MRFLRVMWLGGAASVASAIATPARASDVEVTSDTTSQFYDVRSPTGETVLARRRLTTTLGVGAYDLIDRPTDAPLGPELSFRARVRYDADYGANPGETDPANYQRFVPGYQNELVDLMYGYLEGRRFLKGWLGFKIGRQYVTDALGWWSFDGGEVKVTTPYYVALEAYGGLEVRGGMPLSSPQFERDGIWRGNRSGFDSSLYPSFQPSDIAPAMGFALESTGVTWLHGRLTYRRVLDTGQSSVSDFSSGLTSPGVYSGTRISQERIGYSVDADWATVGSARAGIAYDLYDEKVASIYATLDAFVTKKLVLSLDYDFYQPTFDADSIWNVFAAEPMNDIGARATFDPTDRIALSAHAHARIYDIATAPINNDTFVNVGPAVPNYYPSNGHPFDEGAGVAARYRFGGTVLGARADGNFGDAGDRVGGDVYAEKTFQTHYYATGRLSLWQWDDKLRPDRDATSFGYVAGVGYIFAPRARATVNFDDNMNRLVGQQFRVMLMLSIAVTKMNRVALHVVLALSIALAASLAFAEPPVVAPPPAAPSAAPSTPAPAPAAATSAPTTAAAPATVPAPAPTAMTHGLAPLPDDQRVPGRWLPPGAFDPDSGPSDVIYPAQQITVRFNHKLHMSKDVGLTCKTCHGKTSTSNSAQDSLIPAPTTCDGCHQSAHDNLAKVQAGPGAMGQCAFCHVGYKASDGNAVASLSLPRANLLFPHKKHVDRNIGCAQCHGNVAELELATRDQLPRMRGCFGCHEMPDSASRGDAKSACETCHIRGLGSEAGRMKTLFASGELIPPRWLHNAAHTADFIERHKTIAGNDSEFCANCHSENFCTDCHDGRVRPRSIHPNDFISMHPIEARMASEKCTSCHREQSFCLDCHLRVGVSMSSPPGARDSGRFHPAKSIWSDPPMRPGHHGFEAQRNLNACVSCHTERDCVTCHGAAGVGAGFDPHRSGFTSQCASQFKRNPRPCLVCHEAGDSNLAMCR